MSTTQKGISEALGGNFDPHLHEGAYRADLQAIWAHSLPLQAPVEAAADPTVADEAIDRQDNARTDDLEGLWPPAVDQPRDLDAVHVVRESEAGYFLSSAEPLSWTIAFTPTFRKTVAAVDKTMQGRVLAALSELSQEPTTVRIPLIVTADSGIVTGHSNLS